MCVIAANRSFYLLLFSDSAGAEKCRVTIAP